MCQKTRLLCSILFGCLFVLWGAYALPQEQKPFGQMTIAGKKVDLLHGVALEDDERWTILLTDVPFPRERLAGESARIAHWDSGKVSGVEAHVYKDETVNSDADLYHPVLRGSAWVTDLHIEITGSTADSVTGKITTDPPGDFFGKKYVISANFTLPIVTQ